MHDGRSTGATAIREDPPRQKRTFTPSGAMHEHTARLTVRRAVTGDSYAANDVLLIIAGWAA